MSTENEEHFKVVNFGSYNYFVSNKGRVFNTNYMRFMDPKPTKSGYTHINLSNKGKSKTFYVHRLVAKAHLKPSQKPYIDHKNSIRNDNQSNSLRYATAAENMMNKKVYKNNKTGVKGVYFCKKSKRYQATISAGSIRYYLGSFKTLEEAVAIRQQAELEMHGEYCYSPTKQ